MMERLRVLHITTQLLPHGGIEQNLHLLAQRLDSDRFEMAICPIQNARSNIPASFHTLPVKLFPLNRRGAIYDLFTTLSLWRLVRTYRPHIVHTHNNKANFHGRMAAWLFGRAGLVTTHHDMGDWRVAFGQPFRWTTLSKIDNWVEQIIYPWCNVRMNRLNHRLIAVSHAVAAIEGDSQADPRLRILPAPYDEHLFQPTSSPVSFQARLGTVGRLVWQKGLPVLLEALALVASQKPMVTLRIAGDGPLMSSLRQRASGSDLQGRVLFMGSQSHNDTLYQGLDIYLQPSLFEGSSMTTVEAMAMGLPVIASRTGGLAELVVDGETGLLVPANDPIALSAAIVSLLNNPEQARRLGQAGQKRAQALYTASRYIEQISTLYRQVVREVCP
ncbi:MAG: glycosyltransferase family 4 protein [Magnetococcales bacterium]|nr:glycosyltransferase family 4 protein [Magnetococcales bacterium]